MSYRVQTRAYSGPFDLLLQLVSRQRVDIGAISISEVADQYLAEVERMGELDLDVASDFVLVASTLLDIKAASLVPDDEPTRREDQQDEDEFADLSADEAREVLIARLIAYKQFRNAAAALGSRMEAQARMHPRTAGPDPEFLNTMPDYLEGITLRGLAVICADLDSRREGFLLEAEHIAPKRLPVANPHTTFEALLDGESTPEQVVVTFLAILQLYKLGSVRLTQQDNFGTIEIDRVEGAPTYEVDAAALAELEGEY